MLIQAFMSVVFCVFLIFYIHIYMPSEINAIMKYNTGYAFWGAKINKPANQNTCEYICQNTISVEHNQLMNR